MGLKERARGIVWRDDTRRGRVFDRIVAAMILVSLVAFTLETMPSLSPGARQAVMAAELIAILFFTVEYALRVWTAVDRRAYVFSFWGLVDLAAFLPYWLMAAGFLSTVRVLRLLTLLRVLKLARYARAFERMSRAFSSVREELVVFLMAAAAANFIAATGIYYFESEAQPEKYSSIPESLWWAIVTLTTVGYGDVYPVTVGGRIFTAFVLLTGLGVIAIPTGLISSALQNVRQAEMEGEIAELRRREGERVEAEGPRVGHVG